MKKLFVVQSDDKIVWCPPSAMEPCESLKPPQSAKDEDFKAAARSWISDYKVCKIKQEIIRDCVEKFNAEADKKEK
jgi:hypothetical protein